MTTTNVVDFDAIAPRIEKKLRALFGENTVIDLSPGFEGRVRVKVISPRLNGMPKGEQGNVIWEAINDELGSFQGNVSYVVAYGTDEL